MSYVDKIRKLKKDNEQLRESATRQDFLIETLERLHREDIDARDAVISRLQKENSELLKSNAKLSRENVAHEEKAIFFMKDLVVIVIGMMTEVVECSKELLDGCPKCAILNWIARRFSVKTKIHMHQFLHSLDAHIDGQTSRYQDLSEYIVAATRKELQGE